MGEGVECGLFFRQKRALRRLVPGGKFRLRDIRFNIVLKQRQIGFELLPNFILGALLRDGGHRRFRDNLRCILEERLDRGSILSHRLGLNR